MLPTQSSRLSAFSTAGRRSFRTVINSTVIALAIFFLAGQLSAQAGQPDVKSFFRSIVGEWIGTCEQSTDGNQADNKYFHVAIKQVDPNSFASNFEYYRLDSKTHNPVRIGSSTVTTTIGADGVARNQITGKGTMLVNFKPKEQQHNLLEVLSSSSNGLKGQGSGTLSVNGMPFGLGKNGKVKDAKSQWTLNDGVLSISQSIKAGFRALVFNKNFSVVAKYTARRGSDLASLMSKPRMATKSNTGAGPL